MPHDNFIEHELGKSCTFSTGFLPQALIPDDQHFEDLWALHPEKFDTMEIRNKSLPLPRWQQNYGRSYRYTGHTYPALPLPEKLRAFLEWSQSHIDERLNGVLLNWYEGERDHYIGAHRDNRKPMIPGTPIVTISVGEERVFRLRLWPEKTLHRDFMTGHGSVFITPYATNLAFTHEVPKFKRYRGRRISITLRAFQ